MVQYTTGPWHYKKWRFLYISTIEKTPIFIVPRPCGTTMHVYIYSVVDRGTTKFKGEWEGAMEFNRAPVN